MNQILEYENNNSNIKSSEKNTNNKNILKNYKITFAVCIFMLFISLSFYSFHIYSLEKKENISKKLIDSFNISTLYSDKEDYNALKTSINNNSGISKDIHVIGLLEINSIDLSYPILSDITDDFLKISPCRFYGPMPNEIGNLCIAGHNYKNYKFFSRLNELEIDDIISIQDLNGNRLNYNVYYKNSINADELDCTNQDTNGKREITLITCNSINNSKRIIVKAKETG